MSTDKLWTVRRSANGKMTHRGPRLQWIAVASSGPKQFTLVKPYCGRITLKRSELESWGLSETPEDAIAAFRAKAEWWRECALEEVRHAERDLAFANHRSLDSVLRYAKEVS